MKLSVESVHTDPFVLNNLRNGVKMNILTYDKLVNYTQVLNAITQNFSMANNSGEKTK